MDDSADFRWQDDEQLHLTLRFVGEVDRPLADDLADALGRIRADPFDAAHRRRRPLRAAQFRRAMGRRRTESAARRPRRQNRARLPVGVGLEPERRAFHPHITLARWKGRRTREVQDFLERARRPVVRAVRGRRVHPVRKPPLPARRALRGGGSFPPRVTSGTGSSSTHRRHHEQGSGPVSSCSRPSLSLRKAPIMIRALSLRRAS